MASKILIKRSNVLNEDGTVKLPSTSQMEYGELALNYNKDHETISIKNSENEIVTFSPDEDLDTLSSEPTSTTLISLNGKPYKIGDEVRIADDSTDSGYKVYTLIDIDGNGNAVWVYNGDNSIANQAKIYSITINQDVSDPYKMISSAITDNSRETIEWIRSNSHRYLGTYISGDDMMYLCQLDDNNSEQFPDRTIATLTGGQGDVFMKLPKFYYKAERLVSNGNNWKIGFSMSKVDSTWKCWEGNDLIGTFEAIYANSKLRSIKSTSASTSNVSWADFRQYARNRYGENHGKLVTWEQHCMMAFLYYAYYCNTNCQEQCGGGYATYDKPCGQQLSMIDTTSANGNTKAGINFWGLENWWGNKFEFMDNVSGGSNEFVITTYDGTTGEWGSNRTTTAYNVCNYFGHMTVGEYLDVSSLDSTDASDTTGYCDYFYNDASSGIVQRSNSTSVLDGGVSYANAYYSPSYTNVDFGSRLSYVGPCTLLTSTEYTNKFPIGVFIQDIDGNLYKTSEWDGTKTANGIAVLTSNVRVLLALTEKRSPTTISDSDYTPFENHTTGATNSSIAQMDYNGKTNTENIIQFDSNSKAARWCNSFTFPDGKTKGYLPSLGEWLELHQYKSAVDAALTACGGTAITVYSYWSSTFWGVDNNNNSTRSYWIMYWDYGYGSTNTLSSDAYVRAFASLD